MFEKVSTFIVTEDKKEEEPAAADDVHAPAATSTEEVEVKVKEKEKEIVIESGEPNKEEAPATVVADVAPATKVEEAPKVV